MVTYNNLFFLIYILSINFCVCEIDKNNSLKSKDFYVVPSPQVEFSYRELNHSHTMKNYHKIRMSPSETSFLLRQLTLSKSYFEYGCGGSTRFACENGPHSMKINSVDTYLDWVQKVSLYPCIQTLLLRADKL
jgi:hypothetical protein